MSLQEVTGKLGGPPCPPRAKSRIPAILTHAHMPRRWRRKAACLRCTAIEPPIQPTSNQSSKHVCQAALAFNLVSVELVQAVFLRANELAIQKTKNWYASPHLCGKPGGQVQCHHTSPWAVPACWTHHTTLLGLFVPGRQRAKEKAQVDFGAGGLNRSPWFEMAKPSRRQGQQRASSSASSCRASNGFKSLSMSQLSANGFGSSPIGN